MLDRINAFLLALCIALGVALVVVSISPYQSPPHYGDKPTATDSRERGVPKVIADATAEPDNKAGQKTKAWYSTFTEHTPEWLIAVFTATLWWSTRRLWKAGEKQLHVTQRAILTAAGFHATPLVDPKKQVLGYVIACHWENSGPTAALGVESGLTVERVPGQTVVTVAFKEDPIRERGQNSTIGARTRYGPQRSMSVEELYPTFHKQERLFVIARVEYRDVFGVAHHAQACCEVSMYSDPAILLGIPPDRLQPVLHFGIWREHNSSD